jgi:probable addiction module antidote protein
MSDKYLKFSDYLINTLQDKNEAQEFLNTAISEYEADGDTQAFMLALRYLTEAKGGVTRLSEETKLNRQNLYKVLTGKTIPRIDTTISIIKGLGFHLTSQQSNNAIY